ncbi:KptA family-domain-containing protein [Lentinula edodes]|uniref:KptA family-domain-containing protein n=1 Tax=Lentinula edodes TaxID=5353 RepID=UPI001E8E3978|nr:KptA family-domain-containing protein [Lentinula edodes]KAH7878884.1 KptA family-domain-containing protein [Lentinula edodes]
MAGYHYSSLLYRYKVILPQHSYQNLRGHKRFKDWFEIINVKTAKVGPRLAWLLRHGARYHNLYVRPDGYALVDEVLRISPFRNLNLPDLKELARIDPLKRLQVKELRPHQWWIRATARHSLKFVNPAWKEIRNAREVEGCIYYADGNEWQKIRLEGIRTRLNERLITLSQTVPEYFGYSHIEPSTVIVIHIDVKKALDYGLTFFAKHDKTIATEGDSNGCILPQFFRKVEYLQWSKTIILANKTGSEPTETHARPTP